VRAVRLGLVVLAGCGGVDDLEPCPTGSCTLAGRTTVKWTFNSYPERGFPMDSCVDFSVSKVAVDVVDAEGFATSGIDDCGAAQATFSGLAPGEYTVYVMPLDASMNPLLAAPVSSTVTAGTPGDNREVSVNVPWDAWLGSFTGTFLFRIAWAGASCEDVTPPIMQQRLKLTVNGQVVQIMTDDGQVLDGTDRKPCKKLTDNFPQSALGVPFGPATLLIEGYDATEELRFTKEFDTFVGAGIINPTLMFDVPVLDMPE
jgi:hypothetical protein